MRACAIDFCMECAPGSGSMNGLAIASFAIGAVASVAGAVADAQEAVDAIADNDDALSAAKALSAQMAIAQLAVEAATMAIKSAMGKLIAVPPTQGLIVMGSPTLLIGGFPMIAIPDPMQKLFEKLKASLSKSKPANPEEGKRDARRAPTEPLPALVRARRPLRRRSHRCRNRRVLR